MFLLLLLYSQVLITSGKDVKSCLTNKKLKLGDTDDDKKQAGERIKELREITAYHAKRYYDDDDPEISDFEYMIC